MVAEENSQNPKRRTVVKLGNIITVLSDETTSNHASKRNYCPCLENFSFGKLNKGKGGQYTRKNDGFTRGGGAEEEIL